MPHSSIHHKKCAATRIFAKLFVPLWGEIKKEVIMEATMNDFNVLPTNYINVLLGMSNDTKLRVIRILTDSLLEPETLTTSDKKDYTRAMLKKHAGAWVGDESADEIMSCVRENYSSRSPLEF